MGRIAAVCRMAARRTAVVPAVLLMLVSACTGGAPPPGPSPVGPLPPPVWEFLGTAGLPATGFGLEPDSVAAGDHGFVLAGNDRPLGSAFFTSTDGRAWTRTRPPEVDGHGSVASDGHTVFLAGVTRGGRLVVTRYLGGGRWSRPVPLQPVPGATPPSITIPTNWAIAAGPEGVHVAAHGYDGTVQLWSSRDGTSFTGSLVRLRYNALRDWRFTAVTTPIGTAVLSVSFGVTLHVAALGDFPPASLDGIPDHAIVDYVARNGDRLVVRAVLHHRLKPGDPGHVGEDDPLGENDSHTAVVWCAVTGSTRLREATVDFGALPDLGVDQVYYATGVVPYREGFMMLGHTTTASLPMGALWTSRDGCAWRKDKVRESRFDETGKLVAAATAGEWTVLLGHGDGDTELTHLWLGRA